MLTVNEIHKRLRAYLKTLFEENSLWKNIVREFCLGWSQGCKMVKSTIFMAHIFLRKIVKRLP